MASSSRMITVGRLLGLLGIVASLAAISGHLFSVHAKADEPVWLESAAAKPTPFRERRARETGETLTAVPGTPLRGYLTRPQGAGPFAAVIILHGCGGIFPNVRTAWPERLTSWGYVTLVVDSFSTRGTKDICNRPFVDFPYDAYGALEFLSRQQSVDPARIALMGFSAGAIATLQAVQLGAVEVIMDRQFKAAVAYYPSCSDTSSDMAVPTLILIGELDDWTPAKGCQKMMRERSGKGSPVELEVYAGAHHGFDSADLRPGIMHYGHWIEYNAIAAARSVADVRAFLEMNLAD